MRQDDLVRTINQFLASPPFPACLLLVHPDPSRLIAAVDQMRDLYRWPDWRTGHELSAALLDVLASDRPAAAANWFAKAAAARKPGPVLVTGIDLLFEPALRLDPLRLLLDIGRTVALIVTWPGQVNNDRLAYAVAGHNHYRTWPTSALCPYCVVSL
jgi:hypothetical protein